MLMYCRLIFSVTFAVSDARSALKEDFFTARRSALPSAVTVMGLTDCLSVMLWYNFNKNSLTITRFSPNGSPKTQISTHRMLFGYLTRVYEVGRETREER